MDSLKTEFHSIVVQTRKTVWMILKIMVPISIAVRLLSLSGGIEWIGSLLSPVMSWVGLPGSMGLVWATTACLNIYGGILAYLSLAPMYPLTIAQATVLTSLILFAHTLPIELKIAQKAGVKIRFLLALRLTCAVFYGWLFFSICQSFHWLQEPAHLLLKSLPYDESWTHWMISELITFGKIAFIIFFLMCLMSVLRFFKVIDALNKLLNPVLIRLGISHLTAPLTIVGMLLGMVYGGGLIIQEAQSGKLTGRDVTYALVLLALCHSLIEDTLLMLSIGGHLSGILWGRLAFALLGTWFFVTITKRWPEPRFKLWFLTKK